MTGIGAIITVALLATVGAVVLKGFGFRGASVFSAAVITVMLASAIASARPIFDFFKIIPSAASEYTESVIKAIGIGYATGVTADICRELGENGIAKAVSVGAKIELVLLALPHVYEITELALELMGGGGGV
jgi:stage III sporulation protein AD